MRLLLPPVLLLVGCPDQGLTRFNAEPEATVLAPGAADTIVEGQLVPLRGSASDANDAPAELVATWTAGGAVVCEPVAPDEQGLTACEWTAAVGVGSLRLEVLDPEGAAGVGEVEIVVAPNAAPTVSFERPNESGRYYDGSLVEVDARVDDAEEAAPALSVSFTSSVDGALDLPTTADSDGHVRGATTLTQGEHLLTVRVEDSYGKSAADTVIVQVGPPNTAPTCSIGAPLDEAVGRERDELLLEGTAADAEVSPDLLSAAWSSDKDGLLGAVVPTSAGAISLATTTLSAGTHVLTLTVTDDAGATCVESIRYTVRGAPVVTIDAPADGGVVVAGADTQFSGTATDLESLETDLVVEWSSDRDGTLHRDSPDSAGGTTFFSSALTPGVHVLTLTATDPDGQWTSATATVLVDRVPTAPVVALGPDGARTDDDLVVSIDSPATDGDGDPITYTYAWFVDGVPSTASTSATLPAASTTRDQTWSVVVTPNDGHADGEAGSASLTVANTPPELLSASIDPASPVTDDVLALVTTASDADGDVVDVEVVWSVDGVRAGTRATLDGATAFDKGDEVYAMVSPNDGTDTGTALRTATVTVGNTGPGAATVAIDPSTPSEGVEDLVCVVEAVDPDADTLSWTFDWTVDGVGFSATESTVQPGDTVPATETDAGEVWACTATPSDGSASGAAGTASVTVDVCVYGQAAACAGVSCDDILSSGYAAGDGRYWIDPDAAGAFEVWCDMSTDGGGWTLVAVASDDGADTWTYARRRYWDLDTTTFGSLSALAEDYKSDALHRLPATDVLVVHAPSAVWAAYGGVGTASESFGDLLAGYGDETCWRDSTGFAMTAGGLSASGSLCETSLYLNPADKDGGGSCTCSNCTDDAFGPGFSVDQGDGCGFDDPGSGGSLGPAAGQSSESDALGFGDALGLNTGAAGAAENYVQVYVR